jgi:uncharacterized SAM-dependent methyltransferase
VKATKLSAAVVLDRLTAAGPLANMIDQDMGRLDARVAILEQELATARRLQDILRHAKASLGKDTETDREAFHATYEAERARIEPLLQAMLDNQVP